MICNVWNTNYQNSINYPYLLPYYMERFYFFVGSTDQESSQQVRTWCSEHFFASSLSLVLFLSQRYKYGAKKCPENHVRFNFWDDSTSANQKTGKTMKNPLMEPTIFRYHWKKIIWPHVKNTKSSVYQAFLLMIGRRHALMFVNKSRQKLHRYDQIATNGVFEV